MIPKSIYPEIEAWAKERIANVTGVGGGCIAASSCVVFRSGRKLFIKYVDSGDSMFLREANGLKELRQANAIRIPEVHHAHPRYLILEWISTGEPGPTFFQSFGRQFAQLHRTTGPEFGFYEENFIGASPQKNSGTAREKRSWAEFYFTNRLGFQLQLAEKNGRASEKLRRGLHCLESRIESLLAGTEEPPTLLHGDLWSGNFMVDRQGNPVLIDPAVYYGHREADLAMTKLFGGFSPAFYAAYREAFPLPQGATEREGLYKLYHVLNHWNLFGGSYHDQAVALLYQYL